MCIRRWRDINPAFKMNRERKDFKKDIIPSYVQENPPQDGVIPLKKQRICNNAEVIMQSGGGKSSRAGRSTRHLKTRPSRSTSPMQGGYIKYAKSVLSSWDNSVD
ncbi:hypothetical protein QYM36_003073, partial [Artemia franciscana]